MTDALAAMNPDLPDGRYAAIERIRSMVRKLDYTPLNDAELEEVRRDWAGAIRSSEIEGSFQTPIERANMEMILEERLPAPLKSYAVDLFVHLVVFADHEHSVPFPQPPVVCERLTA